MFNPNVQEVISDWELDNVGLDGHEPIYHKYVCKSYEGDAYTVTRKNGQYYVSCGSHCSCNGLKGQFEPQLVTETYLISEHHTRWSYQEKQFFACSYIDEKRNNIIALSAKICAACTDRHEALDRYDDALATSILGEIDRLAGLLAKEMELKK